MESLRGALLVAAPALTDPNFARTVVLVGEHSADGALGIVLNRPLDAAVTDAVPPLAGVVSADDTLFLGGPVAPESVLMLAAFVDPSASARIVFDDVGFLVVEDDGDPADAGAAVARVRVYAGHSGWGPGQLEAELESDDWILAAARREDVFADEPLSLWRDVLTRLGGRFALLARIPVDPSVN